MTFPKGRLLEHDPASKQPRFAAALAPEPVTKLWPHKAPPVYQYIGSCTGSSTMVLLNSEWAQDQLFGPTIRRWFNSRDGERLYSYATRRDPFPYSWPPTDTGSSGLAAMKALSRDFLLDGKPVAVGYEHAFGAKGLARRLSRSPVSIGIVWPESMDRPDSSGYLRHDPGNTPIESGHQICVVGFNAEDDYFTVLNTWEGWGGVGRERGKPGRARIAYDLMAWLLAQQGDAIIPKLRTLQ